MRSPTHAIIVIFTISGIYAAGACLISTSSARGQVGIEADSLRIVKEAYSSAKENLRSGAGSGVYEVSGKSAEEAQLVPRVKAKFNCYFDRDKYHIKLDYEIDKGSGAKSRIIICDGKSLLTSFFSDRIRPTGAEGEFYAEKKFAGRGSVFAYDPSNLTDVLLNVDLLIKRAPPSLSITRRTDGGFTGTYQLGGSTAQFEVDPKSGFHVVSFQATDAGKRPEADYKATWVQTDNVWYIRELEQNNYDATKSTQRRVVLKYDRFEPNVKLSPELFRFKAAKLPPGARILGRAPDKEAQEYYNDPQVSETDSTKMDNLIAQVKNLPKSPTDLVESKTSFAGPVRWGLLILAGFCSLAGLFLVWRRAFSKQQTSQLPPTGSGG